MRPQGCCRTPWLARALWHRADAAKAAARAPLPRVGQRILNGLDRAPCLRGLGLERHQVLGAVRLGLRKGGDAVVTGCA